MVVRALLYVILNYFWCNPDLSGSENLRVYISTWLLWSPVGVKQEAPPLASLALGAIKNSLVAIGSPSLAPRLNRISLSKFPAWFTLDLKSFRRISIHFLRRRPKPAILIQSILKSPDNGYKFCLFIKLQMMKTKQTIDSKALSSILIGQPSIVVIS